MVKCYVKENSFVARLAAAKLKTSSVAIVIGKTIYLHNVSKDKFVDNVPWLRHEVAHIKQFMQHGYLPFIIKYLWESLKHGYSNNKFELEARAAEKDQGICMDVELVS